MVPFGLHHAFYAPLWFTSAGGSIANIIVNQAGSDAIAPLIVTDENGQRVIRSIVGVAANKDAVKPAGFTAQN